MSETSIATPLPRNMPNPPADSPSNGQDVDAIAPAKLFEGASVWQIAFSFAVTLGTCLVGRVFLSLRSFGVDPDLWWHIKTGENILATHHWPTVDTYSFTVAGHHWLAYEWLGDVLLASVYHLGGLRALGALLIILGSLVVLALYFFTSMRCGNPKAGFLATAILVNLAMVSFNLRPQMLGYLFIVLTMLILERARQGKHWSVWLLPPLMVVWINTHGSWIVGLAIIAVYLVAGLWRFHFGDLETQKWDHSERRRLAIVLALCFLATFVTPYGLGLARYPFQVMAAQSSQLSNVQEWQPLEFAMPGDKLFLVLILGFLSVQLISRRKWRLEEIGLFLFGTAMACIHLRFMMLFVPFFAPLFAVTLAAWLPRYNRAKENYFVNAGVTLAVFAAMLWYFPSRAAYAKTVDENFPVGAVQFLKTHSVPGPLYNNYDFGGYLIWAAAPEHKVFVDGRGEIFEQAGIFNDYSDLSTLKPGSLGVLDKYKIQSCLLEPGEELATTLAASPGWRQVYADNVSVLFVRRQDNAK